MPITSPSRLLVSCGCVAALILSLTCGAAQGAPSAKRHAHALRVTWMPGFRAPGTPARYNKVGVIKVGSPTAKNVLVLVPGTSAGAAYFVPFAKWLAAKTGNWQVWAVERRENLLEDQSRLQAAKDGKASATQAFDYYLGWLADKSIKRHFQFIPNASVEFAKRWGMQVAVGDLRRVIEAARTLGGKVVLGGHSLGGDVVTAYATWNFHGNAGADQLAGLVYDDGASGPPPTSAAGVTAGLAQLNQPSQSPWVQIGQGSVSFPAPLAGLFNATGSLGAALDPSSPSVGQEFPLLPAALKPSVRVTNRAQYGYALDVATSPPSLALAQAHLGHIAAAGPVHGWDGMGALTPIRRYATMFSGVGVNGADGTEWYFPQRMFVDAAAVGNGLANPAQRVVGVATTEGRRLPRSLRIYAFAASLGGPTVLAQARALARQSHISPGHLTLVDRHLSYAHNDPIGAYPRNAFFAHLLPFLATIARGSRRAVSFTG